MNLYQTLVTAVSRINSHKLEDLDRIKHTVIIPILRALNWDDTNPDVFWPNYQVNHCLFDFALLFSDTPFVLIKCCQFKEMEKGELNYLFKHANDEGVGSLILTNGYQWDFFHSKVKDSAKYNQYFRIDLTRDDQFLQYTKYLNLFLGYDSVLSGEAQTMAEKLVSQILERKRVKEKVEIAWDSILEEPNELLVDLLFKSVVRLCGIKPEVEYIKNYLRGKRDDPKPTIIYKPDTEKIIISSKDVSKLTYTSLTNAKFGDFKPAKLNWKSIQILALTSVLDVCRDFDKLRNISHANIVKGLKDDLGFYYIKSHDFSCQGESAPKIAKLIEHCANFLDWEVYLEFEWNNNPNSSYPGKKGSLTYLNKTKSKWFDKLDDF
ncbi:MAG: hypothetical protein OXG88_12030 [Gammaproteobacteria bacterium]|nr:hypothetical protein [Gammaproteobacteria bacterium]MCY3726926.1 hypothetical protein [Paracoccaceae bacterium]